jgi:hypothetical protein
MVYDSIEVFLTKEDAIKYQEFVSYLPCEHFVLECVGKAEDFVTASEVGFRKCNCIQLGYSQVEVKR